MDWQGQKLTEHLMQIMLVASGIVAFFNGYFMESFQLMIYLYAGGVVLTSLITIPNWPYLNRHSFMWLDPSEIEKHQKPEVIEVTDSDSEKEHEIEELPKQEVTGFDSKEEALGEIEEHSKPEVTDSDSEEEETDEIEKHPEPEVTDFDFKEDEYEIIEKQPKPEVTGFDYKAAAHKGILVLL